MYVRLAFSVAAHLEPEILLVDEVLAVGDAEFQRRCLGKMSEIEHSGRTVLFVSHDMEAMARLCTRTMWLDRGRVRATGPTVEVIDAYVRSTGTGGASATFDIDDTKPAQVAAVTVVGEDGGELTSFSSWTKAWICIDLRVNRPTGDIDVGATVSTARGVRLFGETLVESKHRPIDAAGRYRLLVEVPSILMPGTYCVDVWVGTPYEDLVWHERVISFTVATTDRPVSNDRILGLDLQWSMHREHDQ
jgi:ABC-2 type transport system ATP-binding protein/lipopolysaccharide transport system ATP-binding protein